MPVAARQDQQQQRATSSTPTRDATTSSVKRASEHGRAESDHVLLDSGANEVLRQSPIMPKRTSKLQLMLANNTEIEAGRTREGEVVVRGEGKDIIVGVCRLVAIGCEFTWKESGAWLRLPIQCDAQWIALEVCNGLPYVSWEVFVRLRPLLTKWWKEHHTPFVATACTAEEPFVNHAIS